MCLIEVKKTPKPIASYAMLALLGLFSLSLSSRSSCRCRPIQTLPFSPKICSLGLCSVLPRLWRRWSWHFGYEVWDWDYGGEGVRLFSLGFRFWWRGGVRLWVSDFGGVSDEEREMERWRLAVARRLWVEAVRPCTTALWDREIENEKERERVRQEREWEKKCFFLITVFLIFLITKKKKKNQNNVVLAHLTAVDNWGLTEYWIDNNWKLGD